jgi:peroxiredoxin Q/BCP
MIAAALFTFLSLGTGQELRMGQPAPGFELRDQDSKPHRLADYRGRTVVLMFFPKDFTPG